MCASTVITEARSKTLAALHYVRGTGKCNMITEFSTALSYAYIVVKVVIWNVLVTS